MISARMFLDLQAEYPGRIRLIGDTLPNALRYAVMGRPSPAKDTPARQVVAGTVGALLQQVRREAQPQGCVLGKANQSKRARH